TFELTKGLATKAVYNQGTEDEYEVNYNYNMNNQLYEIIKLNAYKYNLTWVDDDVRNIQIQDENGLRVNNCTYTDHIINTNIDMNMFLAGFSVGSYFPNSYFGKKTKHLLKSTDVYTYEYEFDDWDNLTVVTETSKANGKKTIYTIYYDSTIYQ
ncbi:hypothetical protein LJB85_04225, partial [Porphyromonadaceae bacterium OttesenSCG-928-L07]|nr:hypothetical protein [Porphyromonadaceae bacterium OttesenSCG-928-L07]